MYLLMHNAHCTLIQSPAVPADTLKGISGSGAVTRWTGDAQAYIDEDIADVIKGNERVSVSRTLLYLPVNMPVWPNQEDLVTLVRGDVLNPYSNAQPQTITMKVRFIDGGMVGLGRLMLHVVRA